MSLASRKRRRWRREVLRADQAQSDVLCAKVEFVRRSYRKAVDAGECTEEFAAMKFADYCNGLIVSRPEWLARRARKKARG